MHYKLRQERRRGKHLRFLVIIIFVVFLALSFILTLVGYLVDDSYSKDNKNTTIFYNNTNPSSIKDGFPGNATDSFNASFARNGKCQIPVFSGASDRKNDVILA